MGQTGRPASGPFNKFLKTTTLHPFLSAFQDIPEGRCHPMHGYGKRVEDWHAPPERRKGRQTRRKRRSSSR